MHFSKILVTTDLSEASYQAFEFAAAEAKKEKGEVRLLHVVQYYYPLLVTPDIPLVPPGAEFYQQMRREGLAQLDDLAKRFFGSYPVIAEVLLTKDSPSDAICDYAKHNSSTAIVMSSRGHTLLNMLFMGSTVQRVLLRSQIPVVVVPPRI